LEKPKRMIKGRRRKRESLGFSSRLSPGRRCDHRVESDVTIIVVADVQIKIIYPEFKPSRTLE
jgi:hypothetical protein